jgi:type 1 glutamine amidotransferase
MRRHCIFILFACFTHLPGLAQKEKSIRVLIVDGFSNHDWKQTTAVAKWILEKSNLFQVDVSTVPADSLERMAWRPDFKKYKVIIQNTNNIWTQQTRWPREAELLLEKYVKNGGGLYILHSGNNSFTHWAEYDKMIGLGWRPQESGYALEIDADKNIIRIPPGQGKGTSHGKRFNAIIQILNRHPINSGYPASWKTADTEIYNFPRGYAQSTTVLSYAYDSTATKRMWPVEWTVAYGKGRVYNSSLGHLWKGDIYPAGYRCIGFQTTLIRATEWLATGKVSFPVPDDFPTADLISLKSESGFIKE